MSKVHDDYTKESSFSDKNNEIGIKSSNEKCESTHREEINMNKKKILENITNVIIDNFIKIGKKLFQMEECISNDDNLTKDKIIVTINDKKYELLTRKSNELKTKDKSDVCINKRNEKIIMIDDEFIKSNESHEKKQLPHVINPVLSPWYNYESIIQKLISYDEKYYKRMNQDTFKCLQRMQEIMNVFMKESNDEVFSDEMFVNLLDKLQMQLGLNDETFLVIVGALRKKFRNYLLEQIKSIINEQVENKQRIIMGYPALIRFNPNFKTMDDVKKEIIMKKLVSLIECNDDNQLAFSDDWDASQSDRDSEVTVSSAESFESINASAELKSMEVFNAERITFTDDLFQFMNLRGVPIYDLPDINDQRVDIFLLYKLVVLRGGFVEVTDLKLWREIYKIMFNKKYRINYHIYGYSPKIGSYFLRHYYRLYLYPYEQSKEMFTTSLRLLSADIVYSEKGNKKKKKLSKGKKRLDYKGTDFSKEAIRNLVKYLRYNNKRPDPDLFANSITYILEEKYNIDENVETISTTNEIMENNEVYLTSDSSSIENYFPSVESQSE